MSGAGSARRAERAGVVEGAVRAILEAVGEDPAREGLLKTPERVARMYAELLSGYAEDPALVVGDALFSCEGDDLVAVCGVPYASLCEHHILPFVGVAHVGYLPRGRVIGLSKIPRIVDIFARRLQVQERLTQEIAAAIEGVSGARGVMVVLEGEHACASLRGVKKPGVKMITRAARGDFEGDEGLRRAFLEQVRLARP
ncbi:MAG: GTP cyclohydrolase I FolE [Deltaproteobacteria bacterium]|nr:GTP cyclohydrolase I FolE [Deltaproteobacteria bacterium]